MSLRRRAPALRRGASKAGDGCIATREGMLRETPASFDEGSYIFGRPTAQMLTRGRVPILSLLLRGC